MNLPVAVMSARPWMPLVTFSEPEKEDEPVPLTVRLPPMVWSPVRLKLPETLAPPPNDAVPLTSRSPETRTSLLAEM